MTLPCTLYREDGMFSHTMDLPDPDAIALNTPAGCTVILGHRSSDTHLVGGNVQTLPPRPGPWAVWDGTAWADPRTPADMQAALYAARNAAKCDKSQLLMTMATMGILTTPEAIQAAQGVIPPSFEAAIDAMPAEAQGLARIKWAGDQVISRTNPLIALAAYHLGLTDEQLDGAFGVQIPE